MLVLGSRGLTYKDRLIELNLITVERRTQRGYNHFIPDIEGGTNRVDSNSLFKLEENRIGHK